MDPEPLNARYLARKYVRSLLKSIDRELTNQGLNTSPISSTQSSSHTPTSSAARRPFVPHPVSQGADFRTFNAAMNYPLWVQELNRQRQHPSLSSLTNHRPFFPNMRRIVPENFEFPDLRPTNEAATKVEQCPQVSSSNIPATPEHSGTDESDSENISTDPVRLTDELKLQLLVYFGDVCPNVLLSLGPCNATGCSSMTHEVPTVDHLESQLMNHLFSESREVFQLVKTLPEVQRVKYFPAFAKVFSRRKQERHLKLLIAACQESSQTLICWIDIFDAMVLNGWTTYSAIRFLVDNHKDTVATRDIITDLILNTPKQNLFKFADYFSMVAAKQA